MKPKNLKMAENSAAALRRDLGYDDPPSALRRDLGYDDPLTDDPPSAISSALHAIAKAIQEHAAVQKEALKFINDKTRAPQPIRISTKYRRQTHGACSAEQAAKAHELAGRIVAELQKPGRDSEKRVAVAMMIRWVCFGDHPENREAQ